MKKALLWFLAVMITLFTLVYQRLTGPTYPLSGKSTIGGTEISYELLRTHVTTDDCEVSVPAENPNLEGYVIYKRYKTADAYTQLPMEKKGNMLVAYLPKQPSAGKLAYKVFLVYQGEEISLSGEEPVIIRYKDPVPTWVVITHIVVIFLAFLFSNRAGLEALSPKGNPRKLAFLATGFLFLGGMILGPIMQKYAFGAFWTGFPFGIDLTDNKTLIALIGWIIALIASRKGRKVRGWILAAAILTLIVFLIPHSVLGSELKYDELEQPGQIAMLKKEARFLHGPHVY